ncbi:MAG: hypothetical protein ACMV16_05510, partial [Macromonas sp.]
VRLFDQRSGTLDGGGGVNVDGVVGHANSCVWATPLSAQSAVHSRDMAPAVCATAIGTDTVW